MSKIAPKLKKANFKHTVYDDIKIAREDFKQIKEDKRIIFYEPVE